MITAGGNYCLFRLRKASSSRTCPLGRVSDMKRPPFSPLLSGQMITEILSPGLRLVDFQPCRERLFGLFNSMLHLSVPPFSFGTSSSIQLWGLVHSNSLTTPTRVVSFERSNIAKEWCAEAEPATKSRNALNHA